jgi:hypothetical protein
MKKYWVPAKPLLFKVLKKSNHLLFNLENLYRCLKYNSVGKSYYVSGKFVHLLEIQNMEKITDCSKELFEHLEIVDIIDNSTSE